MCDESRRIGEKLWSYCNLLRDDGLSYQDYLEQLTFLLFLQDGRRPWSHHRHRAVDPKGYRWADLSKSDMEGVKLEAH
jgi:type I restriction enzyme M protein